MILVLVVLGLVVAVNCCIMGYLITDVTSHSKRGEHEPGNILGLGAVAEPKPRKAESKMSIISSLTSFWFYRKITGAS
jgi:hypothetical protein